MTEAPQAGWYRHGDLARYWDGAAWTEQYRPISPSAPVPPLRPALRPPPPKTSGGLANWRAATWVVVAWNLLMVAWLVSGIVSVASDNSCDTGTVLSVQDCQSAQAAGAGIGIVIILFVAALGDVILGVIWLVTRKPAAPVRACPICGTTVPPGQVVCTGCGYDYRTQQQGPIPPPPAIWPPPGVTERPKRQRT